MNENVNRSSILELATYLIADSNIDFKTGVSLKDALRELEQTFGKDNLYVQQINRAIGSDSSIGEIAILKTSNNNNGYSSPMGAVCFQDGNSVYVQYRGTPDGGWVQNPISYGADINSANAADGVSSQIQTDGLDFFNKCVKEFAGYGYSGELIVGGHSQGGNVAEYVTIMSEYSSLIALCVSLDGPNHSKALYDYIIEKYGIEYFNQQAQKIIAINGINDYVNMQGQMEFATKDNIYYLITNDEWANENGQGGFWGWHDMLYMMDRDNGGILPYNAEQGSVGQMMTEIVAVINTLSQEQQEDCAKAIMALLELTLGSKNWDDIEKIGINADSWGKLLVSEEFIGFIANGVPALVDEVLKNPALLAQVLNEVVPESIMDAITKFINEAPAPVVIGTLAVAAVLAGTAVVVGAAVVKIYQIADFIITAVQNLKQFGEKVWQAVISICTSIKNGVNDIEQWFRNTFNAGVRYANSNPYFKVDTEKLRTYATRIYNVNNRLSKLDSALRRVFWEVSPLDMWRFAWVNILTSGSPTLNQVKSYLDNAASRFATAESKAHSYMGGISV